ncbi:MULTISPECIES: DUF3149 domain-containing protein [unclassified Paludibacterium]|nr:DUF3149 domain-containing protein [Paludibacterium sp. B53371]BEV70530.1 hypothetical protein THUN1379_00120 [Paludibacterium sp. THUN1379]
MALIQQLLSDDVGLLSLVTIVFATIVVVGCAGILIRKSKQTGPK